jgi:hypothetical protein
VGKVFCIGIDGGLPFEVKDSIERNRIFGYRLFLAQIAAIDENRALCVSYYLCPTGNCGAHLIFVDKPWRTLNSVDNNNNV